MRDCSAREPSRNSRGCFSVSHASDRPVPLVLRGAHQYWWWSAAAQEAVPIKQAWGSASCGSCASGSWGAPGPSVASYVGGTGATKGATVPPEDTAGGMLMLAILFAGGHDGAGDRKLKVPSVRRR